MKEGLWAVKQEWMVLLTKNVRKSCYRISEGFEEKMEMMKEERKMKLGKHFGCRFI